MQKSVFFMASQKQIRILLYVFAGLVVVFGMIWTFTPQAISVETAEVMTGPFEETVVEDGITRVHEKFTVQAITDGNLSRVTIEAGDPVKMGDRVATIRAPEDRAHLAPVTGTILRVLRDNAGPIVRGEPILEIADLEKMEIVADILSKDAVKIQPGQSVRILEWGGTSPLEGRVHAVEPSAFVKISALGVEEQRVNILMDILSPLESRKGLGDQYRVIVEILFFKDANVLKVPTGALFRDAAEWAVYVVTEEGKAQKRKISISRRNSQDAIVESGLKEHEQVILYPGDRVRDGIRVKSE